MRYYRKLEIVRDILFELTQVYENTDNYIQEEAMKQLKHWENIETKILQDKAKQVVEYKIKHLTDKYHIKGGV